MAGCVEHMEAKPCCFENVALVHQHVGRWADDANIAAYQAGEILHRVRQLRRFVATDDKRDLGPSRLERLIATNVVAVSVRVQNSSGLQTSFIEIFEYLVGLQSWIDDHTVAAPRQVGNVRVLAKRHGNNHGDFRSFFGTQKLRTPERVWQMFTLRHVAGVRDLQR